MDEAQEILLNSLKAGGISLPPGVSSIRDLSPDALVSICSQTICLIDDSSTLFPACLPHSMADKSKICADMATTLKKLGYRGDLSFHQFLYPSEKDLRNVLRFLVEKLSKKLLGRIHTAAEDQNQDTVREKYDEVCGSTSLDYSQENKSTRDTAKESEHLSALTVNEQESAEWNGSLVKRFEDRLAILLKESSEIRHEIENSEKQEKFLMEAAKVRSKELQWLKDEHSLLKEAVEVAFDDQHAEDMYVDELKKLVEARKNNLVELELQWDVARLSLEETKAITEQFACQRDSNLSEKLLRLEEIELETKDIVSEILKREKEHRKLSAEVQNLPKTSSRKSYVQRITEITKNSRKQDADIERILKETRELQIESNSIQDRLHRIYALVDETIFRDAKNDPVRRQAHQLLASIHWSFGDISEKILATDRARRDAADLEAKLSGMGTDDSDIQGLLSDLDRLRQENDLLEQNSRLE